MICTTCILLLDYLKEGKGRFEYFKLLLSGQNLWQFWIISFGCGNLTPPVGTESKLNIHMTLRGCSGRLLNVLCTFSWYPFCLGGSFKDLEATWNSKIIPINVNSLTCDWFFHHHWPWHSHPPPLARFATAAAYDLASITRNGKDDDATFVTILEQTANEIVENTTDYDCETKWSSNI